MYCKKCGNEIREGAPFCDKCGEKVDSKQTINISSGNKSFTIDTSKFNILGIVSSLITIISVFLPCIYVTLFGVSVSIKYIQGDGQIVLILGIIAIVLALLGKKIFLTIIGIIDFAIFIYLSHNLSNQYLNILSKDIGYYLLPLGSVLMIISGFIDINKKSINKIDFKSNEYVNKVSQFIKSAKERIKLYFNNSTKISKNTIRNEIIGAIVIAVIVILLSFLFNLKNPGHFVKTNNEIHYKLKNGDFAESEWIKHNGDEYYFNENGILQKKKWVDTDYYVDADGKKKKNSFIEDGSKQYYLKADGKYAKNELVNVNGKTYAFDDNGANIKSKTYKNASPSYICYVNNDGYVEKRKGLNTIGSDSIYVLDGDTGALLKSDWYKDEKTNKYMYFDEKGLMAKDRLIVGLVTDAGDTLYLNDYHKNLLKSKVDLIFTYILVASLGVPKYYYYVDKDGYMVTNDEKDIDGYMWKFDDSGYGTKQLWKQSNYSNSSKNYIINKKYYAGIYKDSTKYSSKSGYLEICVDNDDVTLFLYEGETKRQVKNNLSYSSVDYNLEIESKSIPDNYRFSGTMYSDRIFIDNSSAETTIKNLLLSGEEFRLTVSEDSYWDDTYYFVIDSGDFQNIYNKTFSK